MLDSPPITLSDVRSKKERHIREFMQRKRLQVLELAEYVERHPESLQTAVRHVDKFLASPSHVRIHWILNQWRLLLLSSDPSKVAAIFRDDSESTRDLRENPPYFGPADA